MVVLLEMADAAKTGMKRKSLVGKQDSVKKTKLNLSKTPSKGVTPKGGPKKTPNASPKVQKNSPKGQNGVPNTPKSDKKQKNKQPLESAEKLTPFKGTAAIQSPKKQPNLKKVKAAKGNQEKPGKSIFFQYKQILSSGDASAKKSLVSTIDSRIKTIEDRPDPLTKTAKRKLKILKRIKKSAEKGSSTLLPSLDGANPTLSQNKKGENTVATGKKGNLQKQKKTQPQQKQKGPKKPALELEEEDDDSDEELDDEADSDEVDEESMDESDDGGEEEEESDDEGEEGEGEEDEDDSDDGEEDSDEEDNPTPKQVSNKKQKKKN